MVRRATTRKQGRKERREKRIILIATEGNNKTEKTYFREFNDRQNEFRIQFASGNSTDPVGIVKDADTSARRMEVSADNGDEVIAIFDTDFGKESQIEEARRLANKCDVRLLLSNPCFEIWLLLHFRFSTRGYQRNEEVIRELNNRWPAYGKNLDSFIYLEDRQEVAIENARKLEAYYHSMNTEDTIEFRNPSTNVHWLVELLKEGGGGLKDI